MGCAVSMCLGKFFVPGLCGTVIPTVASICGEPIVRVSAVPMCKKRNALDLCSGLGSATCVLEEHGVLVVSVEKDPKWGLALTPLGNFGRAGCGMFRNPQHEVFKNAHPRLQSGQRKQSPHCPKHGFHELDSRP